MKLTCAGLLVLLATVSGCLPDNPPVSETGEDPDTTGPGPWISGGDPELALACEECPESSEPTDGEIIEAPVICSCNLPVSGGQMWFERGTACGTKNQFGYWKETEIATLEEDCADALSDNAPLVQTQFTCEPIVCGEMDPPASGYSCSGWDPAGDITLVNGVYGVDATLINDLINDFRPLVFCDDARLQAITGGGFEVEDADAGEFLYELGLRDGDIPLELNDYPLDDVGDVHDAFAELWLTDFEGNYDLVVLRGSSRITLSYEVLVSL
jgi:hypothetical protein